MKTPKTYKTNMTTEERKKYNDYHREYQRVYQREYVRRHKEARKIIQQRYYDKTRAEILLNTPLINSDEIIFKFDEMLLQTDEILLEIDAMVEDVDVMISKFTSTS